MNSSNSENRRAFSQMGKNSLYKTVNMQYGTSWMQDKTRPEHVDIKHEKIPTYSEIVQSMNDFKKAERLIKKKVINEKLQSQKIDPNATNVKYLKKTDFHAKPELYQYPEHGLNVGPPIYRTNNMNYGSNKPAQFEIQNKYHPCNSTFTKEFSGGNFKFNGLNTIRTLSGVHSALNDF